MRRLFGRHREKSPDRASSSFWKDNDELATLVHHTNYCIEVPTACATCVAVGEGEQEQEEEEETPAALTVVESFLGLVNDNLLQAAAKCLDPHVHMDHALLKGKVDVTSAAAWSQACANNGLVAYQGVRWQGLTMGAHDAQVVRWGYHRRIGSVLEVFQVNEENRIVHCHVRKALGKYVMIDFWAKSAGCRKVLEDSASDMEFDIGLLVKHVEERLLACNMWT
jgi:hypothetical protein